VIVAVVLLHLVALHRFGSNNPDGIETTKSQDTIPFHPYYTIKDLLGLAVFLIVFGWFVFYEPSVLLNPDNSIPANPGVTPAEIVPEWYLLPYYAILKSIPNKLLGVFAMAGSILVLLVVPWLDTSPVGPLPARVPGVFLDPGGRLRTTHLCRGTTARGDVVVPDPNWRCVLFPAFPPGAAPRRQVRAPAAAPV